MEENKSVQNVLRRLCRLVFFYYVEKIILPTWLCKMMENTTVLKISLANSQKVVYSGIKSGGKWWKVSRSGKNEGIKLRKPHTMDGSW